MQPTAAIDPATFGQYSDWAKQNMANGVSANDLHQSLQQGGAQIKPEHSGNWFTHLLPTIGGVGGSILGGIGTLGLGGEFIGGAGGAAAGKALQNALEGKGVLDKAVVNEGIMGGVGTLAGGVLGKVFGGGSKMLGSRATQLLEGAGKVEGAAGDLVNSKTLNAIYSASKHDVGGAAELASKAGIDMTNPANLHQAGKGILDNAGQLLDNIVGTTKIPISGVVDETGKKTLPSIHDLIHSSLTNTNELTGEKLGASRSLVMGGLGSDLTDEQLLRNGYTKFLGSSTKNGVNTPATNFLKEADQLLSGVNHGSSASAHDLLEAQRLVGDKSYSMAKAASKPSANEVTQAQADSWNDLNHKLKDMIYSHPEVSEAAKGMIGKSGAAEFGGNQALADLFNSRVTTAQSGKDLNGLMHDAYNMRDVGTDGLEMINNPASTGNLKLAKINESTVSQGSKPGIGHAIVNAPSGILGKTLAIGKHAVDNPTALSTLSRIGDIAAKVAPIAGAGVATIPNMAPSPVGATMSTNNPMDGNNMQPGQTNTLQDTLNAYKTLGILDPAGYGQQSSSLIGSLAPMLQKNQLLSSVMGGMPDAYGNAGGAQGGGGFLSHLTGLIPGTAAHTYKNEQESAAAQLAQALGISPQAAMGLLPQLMQNSDTSGQQQSVLGQLQGQLVH